MPRLRSGRTRRSGTAWLLAALAAFAVAGGATAADDGHGLFSPDRAKLGGYAESEIRLFPETPIDPRQETVDGSFAAKPELYLEWGRDYSLNIVPFGRYDAQDANRTHADLREFIFTRHGSDWDGRIGVGKVFWGVTEGRHVVDIINQTDLVEDPDMREKLGQPMVNVAFYRDWGTLSLFVLPGFRERTFPVRDSRLHTFPAPVTNRDAIYESGMGQAHVDFAGRWQKTFGELDVGVSYFDGTSRDPDYKLSFEGTTPVLIPRYDLIHQGGLELQYAFGSTLLKAESFGRAGQGKTYAAADVGFEHTLTGVFGTKIDTGILGEYLYEGRKCCGGGDRIFFDPLQDDFLIGLRFAFNDTASSDALITLIIDRITGSKILRVEASRRIGDGVRLELESDTFLDVGPDDQALYTLRRDSYVQIKLQYYF